VLLCRCQVGRNGRVFLHLLLLLRLRGGGGVTSGIEYAGKGRGGRGGRVRKRGSKRGKHKNTTKNKDLLLYSNSSERKRGREEGREVCRKTTYLTMGLMLSMNSAYSLWAAKGRGPIAFTMSSWLIVSFCSKRRGGREGGGGKEE